MKRGEKLKNVVLDSRFWNKVTKCLKVVTPLVDSNIKSAMGFIHEEIDCEKKMKCNFNNIKR